MAKNAAMHFDPNYEAAKMLETLSLINLTQSGKRFDIGLDVYYEFEKCIEIDPKFKKALLDCTYLGIVIYIKKKSYTKAINELKEAISIDHGLTVQEEAYFNLGLAYLRLGRFDDAKNAANDALQIDPNYEAKKVKQANRALSKKKRAYERQHRKLLINALISYR